MRKFSVLLALMGAVFLAIGFAFTFAAPSAVIAANDVQNITGMTVANTSSDETLGPAAMITMNEPTDKKILAAATRTTSGADTAMTKALALNHYGGVFSSGGGSVANTMTTSKMEAVYICDTGRVDLVLRL